LRNAIAARIAVTIAPAASTPVKIAVSQVGAVSVSATVWPARCMHAACHDECSDIAAIISGWTRECGRASPAGGVSSPVPEAMARDLLGGRKDLRMEHFSTLQLQRSGLEGYLVEMLHQETQ
jgi:hypothetical protein